jgi:putative endonuclease
VADRTRTPAQQLGDSAETLVADRLTAAGWTILARNVRLGRDELDLIATDPGPPSTTVVVEVRWRARRDFGFPEETVDARKRSRLRRAAWRWREASAVRSRPIRFDLVVVEPPAAAEGSVRIRHHRAAF